MNLNQEQLEAEFGRPIEVETTVGIAMALSGCVAIAHQCRDLDMDGSMLVSARYFVESMAAQIEKDCPQSARLIREQLIMRRE